MMIQLTDNDDRLKPTLERAKTNHEESSLLKKFRNGIYASYLLSPLGYLFSYDRHVLARKFFREL